MKKRRSWSDDEKREICQQTMPPGVSVAQVARCYAMNANMIYTWLKDPRFAPPAVAPEDALEGSWTVAEHIEELSPGGRSLSTSPRGRVHRTFTS